MPKKTNTSQLKAIFLSHSTKCDKYSFVKHKQIALKPYK